MDSTAEDLTMETMRQSAVDANSVGGKPIQTNTFEEVENKLQEMFAGIDDEQTVSSDKAANINTATTAIQQEVVPSNWPKEKPLQTKAAKKSTETYLKDMAGDKPNNNNVKLPKNIGARRRLSVNMTPSQLSLLSAVSEEVKKSKPKNANGKNNLNNGKTTEHTDKKSSSNKKGGNKDSSKKKKIRPPANYSSSENESEKPEKKIISVSEDSRYYSPYIIVKQDGSVSVMNTAATEDINGEHPKAKNSRSYSNHRQSVKGLHTSTLSNKYDADTADSTWICVFCKFGPHKKSQGDLFGPYSVTTECEEYKANIKNENPLKTNCDRTNAKTPTSPRKKGLLENDCQDLAKHNHETEQLYLANCCGDDMSNIYTDSYLGMSRVTESSYEAWVHEDCAIWAPNIFLVGPRIVGLDSAIWNSVHYKCVLCLKSGAAICCLQRDCKVMAHVPCARELDWSIDEDCFRSYCQRHKR